VHQRALCARADRVLCISNATRDDVVSLLGIASERTRVTHLAGREWRTIAPVAVPGIGVPFFLWVGARGGYKNFVAAAAAWARSAAAKGTRLLCVGGGPLSPAERTALDRAGAGTRVVQRAASDGELRWAYEHAEGLIYAALWEGFGLPVLEALALDCPVVASDVAALREVGGDAPFYADPAREESLVEAIRACREQGRTSERAALGRAQAARFSWDACAASVEAVYRELDA
jgi:glycosyltransferase involved in cell wall biosynthesis